MRHGADGRCPATLFRTILPGGDGFYSVRRGSHLFVSLGVCVSRIALVRLRRNDAVHRDFVGGLHLSLEKGRAGLAYIGAHSVREKHSRREREYQSER